jgi:hypothetical protein
MKMGNAVEARRGRSSQAYAVGYSSLFRGHVTARVPLKIMLTYEPGLP